MSNRISGPMPLEEFKALVDLPYGKAIEALRKYDPFWGRKPGEVMKWRVRVEQEVTMVAEVFVDAATDDEAQEIVEGMKESDFSWSDDAYGTTIITEVTPA